MTSYDFRLRFNLNEGSRINSDAASIELSTSNRQRLILKSSTNKALKDSSRLAMTGTGFISEEEAKVTGLKAKTALMYWATKQHVGIDFGDGIQRSGVTKYFQQKFGYPLRSDIHGLVVYEHIDDLHFIGMNANAQVGKSIDTLLDIFSIQYNTGRQLNERELLAVEIYLSSFFDISPRSRFLTLMTAIESLLDYTENTDDVLSLVSEFEKRVETSNIETAKITSLLSRLRELKHQSIGQAGREFVGRMLPEHTFDGKNADKFFTFLYEKRSQLVHTGHVEDTKDIRQLVNIAESFVNKLILAVLNDVA